MKKCLFIPLISILLILLFVLSFQFVFAKIFFTSGFETADLRDWSETNVALGWTDESGNPQPPPLVSSANPFSGTYSLLFPSQYHSQCVSTHVTLPMPVFYMQCEVYFDALPSASNIVTFMTAIAQSNDWKNIINAAIYNDDGTVKWIIDTPPFYPDDPSHEISAKADFGPAAGRYYCVQLGCTRSGSTIISNLWVNGQNVISNYSYNGSSANFGQFLFGSYDKNTPGQFDGITVYLDDAKISDNYLEYLAPSPTTIQTNKIVPTFTQTMSPTISPSLPPSFTSNTTTPISMKGETFLTPVGIIIVSLALAGTVALYSTFKKRQKKK